MPIVANIQITWQWSSRLNTCAIARRSLVSRSSTELSQLGYHTRFVSELQKHEVCFTDINNGETKTACSQECGGQVEEMAERLHRLMAHHMGVDSNVTGVEGPSAAVHNATIATCRYDRC